MKARHEFNTDHEYRDYLLAYFAGQIMTHQRADGSHQSAAEWSIRRANSLIGALEAFLPEQDTFDY